MQLAAWQCAAPGEGGVAGMKRTSSLQPEGCAAFPWPLQGTGVPAEQPAQLLVPVQHRCLCCSMLALHRGAELCFLGHLPCTAGC